MSKKIANKNSNSKFSSKTIKKSKSPFKKSLKKNLVSIKGDLTKKKSLIEVKNIKNLFTNSTKSSPKSFAKKSKSIKKINNDSQNVFKSGTKTSKSNLSLNTLNKPSSKNDSISQKAHNHLNTKTSLSENSISSKNINEKSSVSTTNKYFSKDSKIPRNSALTKEQLRPRKIHNWKEDRKRKEMGNRDVIMKQDSEADVWFDDVDEELLGIAYNNNNNNNNKIIKKSNNTSNKKLPFNNKENKSEEIESTTNNKNNNNNPIIKNNTQTTTTTSSLDSVRKNYASNKITNALSLDCEMVGVGEGGRDSVVARVSMVNSMGQCVMDEYVKPTEKVTDYRTKYSGIRPHHLINACEFKDIQRRVFDLLKERILVGHALHHDLKVLYLDHPRKKTRDTSTYKAFRKVVGGGVPSLKKLTKELLGVDIQEGEHDSIQDAKSAMSLYMMYRKEWEGGIVEGRKRDKGVMGGKVDERMRIKE